MLICLVGKSGSGKSTVANLLCMHSKDILHVDIDTISHQIVNQKEVSAKLVDTFGNSILKDNQINRKELGRIVFNSTECMQKLEDITWPAMESEIDKIITDHRNRIVLLDWQLLPKTKYFKTCNMKILVTAPLDIRMKRAMLRDGITEEKFQEREHASLSFDEEDFDYIVYNDDREKLDEEVLKIYEKSIIHW